MLFPYLYSLILNQNDELIVKIQNDPFYESFHLKMETIFFAPGERLGKVC